MAASTNPNVRHLRDEAVDAALHNLMNNNTAAIDPAVIAYRVGVTTLVRRVNDLDITIEELRGQFEDEIDRRVEGAMNNAHQFTMTQLDNLRLLVLSFKTQSSLYDIVWREELLGNNMDVARSHQGGQRRTRDDEEDVEMRDDDDMWWKEDGGGDGSLGGDVEQDGNSKEEDDEDMDDADGGDDEKGHDNNDDGDDDCIMFGMYRGDADFKHRYVCLLCPHHGGTQHKSSFVRHLWSVHEIRDVHSVLNGLHSGRPNSTR
ncbi:hypothetical protein LTR10_016954 [Elasticomyces elasticus]|uniref:Uncharacterized protein n=1 Tax=Exophiala sideris TaxID=1016849 RepID=A0ABR0JEX5_9EURO|nr:hypothetical protein LTR10_016954 [Elasticomyces elasticus]KAK5025208.1 hypothetical protein LTS07_008059 [Exophiala sideris]KAK5029244.1 hypothetical protein LTR13_008781 [Exophiala sideris]KAK5063267.1 hypothetical protein LTR69_003973 [Exophiala sideris]KAK5178983.1 hypothetical protein LTR44_008472 [Eurotiomycetes sp. CCFEE 6388]